MADTLDIQFEGVGDVKPVSETVDSVIGPHTPIEKVQQLKQDLIQVGKWATLPKEVKLEITSKSGEMPNRETGEAVTAEDLASGVAGANPVGGMGGKALKKLLGGAAEKVGLTKIPDYLMQAAAGVKKIIPGMGSEMIDQGLIGTRGMIGKQAEQKIPVLAQQLEQEVSKLPGQVSHKQVSQDILERAKRFQTPSGYIPEADQAAVDAITARAKEVGARKAASTTEALSLKKQAGARGWSRGTPLSGIENELNRAETMGYGKQLEGLADESTINLDLGVEPSENKVKALNRAQEALFKAKRGADRGTSPLVSLLKRGATSAAGGAVGGALGGEQGAKTGAAIGATVPQELLMSAAAQAMARGGPALTGLAGLLLPGQAQKLQNQKLLPQETQSVAPTQLDIRFDE